MKLDNPATALPPDSDAPDASAQSDSPRIGIATLLGREHRRLLERPPDEPFENELEYLRSVEADIRIVALARDSRDHVHDVILQGDAAATSNGVLASIRELAGLRTQFATLTSRRLDASSRVGRRPILAALMDRLGLTGSERAAFSYVVVVSWDGTSRKGEDRFQPCAAYAGLSSSEMSAFFAPERLHMRQGLIEIRRVGAMLPELDSFTIPDAVIRIVAGETPAATDCLFLQETVLEPEATRLLPASPEPLAPYANDIEYLTDHFEWINRMVEVRAAQVASRRPEPPSEATIRSLAGQVRRLRLKCEARVAATRRAGGQIPRLEKLTDDRGLTSDERLVILALAASATRSDPKTDYRFGNTVEVWGLIQLLTDTFAGAVELRKLFYRNGALRRQGLIRVEDSFLKDLMSANVVLDRRILEYILGLEIEASEFADGSHIYLPEASLDRVVLPADMKALVVNTALHYDSFKAARARFGLDDTLAYGRGLTMLFHGASGTGKTLLANAIAGALGKRVLLANFPSLGSSPEEVLGLLFREARLQSAMLLFDECDGLFQSRDQQNPWVGPLLTELERHDDLVVLATNRPMALDDAMHRRITLSIEFRPPDEALRWQIWKTLVPSVLIDEGAVDYQSLARHRLTGGLIKNAILLALSLAVSRDPDDPKVTQADLERGAELQARSKRAVVGFPRRNTADLTHQDLES